MESIPDRFENLTCEPGEDLVAKLYQELKLMARGRLIHEKAQLTLNTTALVHEVWLRLEKSSPERWRDRAQFFAAASEAMRRILVEAARKRLAIKRGAGPDMIPLDEVEVGAVATDERLLAVHEALDRLEAEDEFKARIVKLRFFSGMDHEEIAAILEVNEKTVRRHWTVAKVWLYRALDPAD